MHDMKRKVCSLSLTSRVAKSLPQAAQVLTADSSSATSHTAVSLRRYASMSPQQGTQRRVMTDENKRTRSGNPDGESEIAAQQVALTLTHHVS